MSMASHTIEPPTDITSGLDARLVMDAAPVMIWVSGKDKHCVWFNKPWLTFTGRPLAEELVMVGHRESIRTILTAV
jgi:PAS domain-containing protein